MGGAGTRPRAWGGSLPCCLARYLSALQIIPLPHPTRFSLSSPCLWAARSKSRNRAWVAANRSTLILQRYSRVLALSLLACWVVHGVTNTSAGTPANKQLPPMRSANSANSVSDIPHPVLGSLYTRNSVSLNKSTEKVPSETLVQALQMSLQMPAFQQ